MTDLIPLDAALVSLYSHAHGTTTLGGQTYRSITLEVAVEALQAIPTIDPAAIREAALREAARIIVTHEMGTPMHSPPQLLTEAHDRILALIGEKK